VEQRARASFVLDGIFIGKKDRSRSGEAVLD
jgi:hypothetical protein